MSDSWLFYAPVRIKAAEQAVEATYEALTKIVGDDIADEAEPGEKLDPPELGIWPDLSVPPKPYIPSAEEERASLTDPYKVDVTFEEAALERLAKCTAVIRIDEPQGFDPALVSALRILIKKLGPCVFTGGEGFDLTTSETLLEELAKHPDLEAAVTSAEEKVDEKKSRGKEAEDEDDDEDEDDEDEDDEDEDDDGDSEDAKPEVLRSMLADIAQQPRLRRRVGELLDGAPKTVGAYTERLARVGAEPDATVAKALGITEKEAATARLGLAALLQRAEGGGR